jgi:hypothetical protein
VDEIPVVPIEANGHQIKCTVSNSKGAVESNIAVLTVVPETTPVEPVVTVHPESVTVSIGGSASFSVTATSDVPMTYQWQKLVVGEAWIDIVGAIANAYTYPNIVAETDGEQIRCVVTNSAGVAFSNPATISVPQPPEPPTNLELIEQIVGVLERMERGFQEQSEMIAEVTEILRQVR